MTAPLRRRALAEALGSMLLFACVIGSGVTAERLSDINVAVALLGNTLATAAMLLVLVSVLGPVSGAHMNPTVRLVAVLRRKLSGGDGAAYVAAQLAGSSRVAGAPSPVTWLDRLWPGRRVLDV